jgi:hypothetical protein
VPLHHYVPQFLLRGFADENNQLVTTMRSDFRASHKAVVGRTAAEKGFYRIPVEGPDHEIGGVQDPEFIEHALADFESLAAQDVRAIVAGAPITPAVHARLATLIGLQLTRTPRFRSEYVDVANVAARRVVEKITDERLHQHLTKHGRPNSPQDVSRLRNEVFDAEFTMVPSAPQLVQDTLRHGLETLFPHLVTRTPHVLRFSQPLLLTSDAGAAPWSPGDPAPWSSGIANAHTIFLPLNRLIAFEGVAGVGASVAG